MRKAPIYILLFLYTAVQLRPLTVVLQDMAAHTFFRMQHMATVHYENGHYHLHTELKNISEQEQNSGTQKTSSEKTAELAWQQVITEFHFDFNPPVTVVSFYSSSGKDLHEGYILSAFRPPALA